MFKIKESTARYDCKKLIKDEDQSVKFKFDIVAMLEVVALKKAWELLPLRVKSVTDQLEIVAFDSIKLICDLSLLIFEKVTEVTINSELKTLSIKQSWSLTVVSL